MSANRAAIYGPHYTERDVQIVEGGVEFVRKRRGMFVGPDPVRGVDLATRIAHGAFLLGRDHVVICYKNMWWVIGRTADWIGNRPDHPIGDLFSRMFPFPEAGDNLVRPEILLPAFAQDVLTRGPDGGLLVVAGNVGDDNVGQVLASNVNWKRSIAFRMP